MVSKNLEFKGQVISGVTHWKLLAYDHRPTWNMKKDQD